MPLSHPIGEASDPRDLQAALSGGVPGDANILSILDSIDVPIVVVGRDCKVVRFNRAAREVFELTPAEIGKLPGNIRGLEDVKGLEDFCSRVFRDGTPLLRDIQKSDRWFVLHLAPYTGSKDEIEGAVLTFTNVTAFRASIGQAIYEREYTKAIFNTMNEAIVLLDGDLRVQTANRAFYQMFGTSREKVQTVPLPDLGDDHWKRSSLWTGLKTVLSDNTEFRKIEIERDFGSGRRTVLLDASRFSHNGNATLVLVFQDITERKRTEEHLRCTQQELRDFVENASLGMHWVGPDGIILWANRAELDMLGYAREEYIGRHIAEYHVDKPLIEDILRRLSNHETLREYEARLRCKDGSIRTVLINSNVLWDGDKFIHTRCFTRDITEHKQAQDYIAQLLNQEQMAREEAERANRLKDEFLATVSHELKTPLNAIHGWTLMLQSEFVRDPKHALAIIERNAKNQLRLIDELLDMSRIVTGKLRLNVTRMNLRGVIESAMETVWPAARAKGVTLENRFGKDAVMIHGDQDRLQQVFWNLLNNAVQHTPMGGQITVGLESNADIVRIWVRDNGEGIDASFLAYVFEPLRQGDGSTTRKHGGLGLGLSIVRRIVDLHGGTVQVESGGRGHGARFTVQLPTVMSCTVAEYYERASSESTADRQSPVLRNIKVLCVDDEVDALEMVHTLLEECGATVKTAVSVDQALAILGQWQPDLILSDIAMPEEDGYAFIQKIRMRGADDGGQIPAVALTARTLAQDRIAALRAGYQSFVPKPINPDELIAVVHSLVG